MDKWWTFGGHLVDKIRVPVKFTTYTIARMNFVANLQNLYNIPTNTLQNIYTFSTGHLAGGVAFSKYNFEKFRGFGMFPNKQLGKVGPQFHRLQSSKCIYVYTACQFAKPVQVCIACQVSTF